MGLELSGILLVSLELNLLGINSRNGHESGDLSVAHLHHRVKVGRVHEDWGLSSRSIINSLFNSLGGDWFRRNGSVSSLLASKSLEEAFLLASSLLVGLSGTSSSSSASTDAGTAEADSSKDTSNGDCNNAASLVSKSFAAESARGKCNGSSAINVVGGGEADGFSVIIGVAGEFKVGDERKAWIANFSEVRNQNFVVGDLRNRVRASFSEVDVITRSFLEADRGIHVLTSWLGSNSAAKIEEDGISVFIDIGHIDVFKSTDIIVFSIKSNAAFVGKDDADKGQDQK